MSVDVKEAKDKVTALEIAKIIAQWLSLPVGTLILALVPQVRDRIWPATPKGLLLALLIISLSVVLGLVPYALRLRRKLKIAAPCEAELAEAQGQCRTLDAQLSQANAENARLNEQVKDLTHHDLDETDDKLLLLIANADHYSRRQVRVFAEQLGIHLHVAQHLLDHLCANRYAKQVRRPGSSSAFYYDLADRGREYLIRNNKI